MVWKNVMMIWALISNKWFNAVREGYPIPFHLFALSTCSGLI